MNDLNPTYEDFKSRERDLIRTAKHERLIRSLAKPTRTSNRNLAQMGRFLVKIGTYLIESYDYDLSPSYNNKSQRVNI